MLKKLIVPVQQLLLKNSQCVGCGRNLKNQKQEIHKDKTLIYCVCGRIFVKEENKYRRASFEEVK
jgi:DNA-directed RNA polymerase subunit RPC12/RpoP